jgi:hypothetical protein
VPRVGAVSRVFSSEVEAGSHSNLADCVDLSAVENTSNKRGEEVRPDKARERKISGIGKRWDRQTRKKPAVPCRLIEIAGRKCGFAVPA